MVVWFVATFRVARLTLQTRILWLVSRPTVTRVTFDLPECKENVKYENKRKGWWIVWFGGLVVWWCGGLVAWQLRVLVWEV